ncbi:hypothetical protein EJB05_37062, partial [Eragrostis curvula]
HHPTPTLTTPRSILIPQSCSRYTQIHPRSRNFYSVPPAPFAIFPAAAVPIHPRCCPRPLPLPSTTDGLSSPKTPMAPGRTLRKGILLPSFHSFYIAIYVTLHRLLASQVSEGKGRSGRGCKRVVAPDRQVHGTRITRQRTRELANSNDTTQKGALEDENQAQDEGTRTQQGGTQEDQRQVQEEGTRPILLAEEVTSTQEEGTPEDESQAKDEGTRQILLAEEVTSTQEEGTPEDDSQAKDEGTRPILLAEEVTSTQKEGTPEDETQAQDEGTRPILLAEEVTSTQEEGTLENERAQDESTRPILLAEEIISTQEGGTPEDQRQVQEEAEKVTSTQEEGTPEDQGQVQEDGKYRMKKKYFDGVPASEVTATSPVSSMTDEQWGKLVKMWSSPKHKDICLLNQHNREKVQFNHRTGSRCYIAQLHALRDKYKDEDPTPLELFKEFHSSQKTGFISEPIQKAIDHMEAMMDNPVEEGQEPPSTESVVREVVRSSTFLRAVGISPKKRSRVSRSS